MENAAQALEYAFAVFVFVIALSVSMSSLGKAKETSDTLYEALDTTAYYEDVELSPEEIRTHGRIVGVENIIPTIYRDFKEDYVIEFYTKDANTNGMKPDYLFLRLDLSVENKTGQIWTANANVDVKKRLDLLVSNSDVTLNNVIYGGATYNGTYKGGIINNQLYEREKDIALPTQDNRNLYSGRDVYLSNAGTSANARNAMNYISANGLYEYCEGKQFIEVYAYLLDENDQRYAKQKITERIDKIVVRYIEQ